MKKTHQGNRKNVQVVVNSKNFKEDKTCEVKRHWIKKNNKYNHNIKVKFSSPSAATLFINQYRTTYQPT